MTSNEDSGGARQRGSDAAAEKKSSGHIQRGLGGIVHTYLGYDAKNFPSPTSPPPDVSGFAFQHMMAYGSLRNLTEEELANAIRLDPSQIQGLGPSLESLLAMLMERKNKILSTYETTAAQAAADRAYKERARAARPPKALRDEFKKLIDAEQIRELEKLWYKVNDDTSDFAGDLTMVIDGLGNKYQIEKLASAYHFRGREKMTVDEALAVKEELETIDELIEQLREAAKNAQLAVIDMDALSEFAEPGEMENLRALQDRIQEFVRQEAERQGLEMTERGYELTPQAYKLFQGKLLAEIFSDLEASRSGRHDGPVVGEGPVEMQRTKPYEFGDPVSSMDIPGTFVNAMVRGAGETERRRDRETNSGAMPGRPAISLRSDDIQVHLTKNNPKCATAVLMDMSGSMRYDGQYINVKRMALGLDGLIRREYPGDYLQFIEMYSLARPCHSSEIVKLLPKPVTVHQPVVRLKADMSRTDASELAIPPHFTNIQRSLQMARQFLSAQDTPNRQVILITDGLPTAHFEGSMLYLLYPPDPSTEKATMREAMLCRRENITINIFLLPSWSQSSEDIQFAQKMAEATKGRVFFTGGRDLDRYVLWDYVNQRRKIIG